VVLLAVAAAPVSSAKGASNAKRGCGHYKATGQPAPSAPQPVSEATLSFTCDYLGPHPVPKGLQPQIRIVVSTPGARTNLFQSTRNSKPIGNFCANGYPSNGFTCTLNGSQVTNKGSYKFGWQSQGPAGFQATCGEQIDLTIKLYGLDVRRGTLRSLRKVAATSLTATC
jgi:hypothetical protein